MQINDATTLFLRQAFGAQNQSVRNSMQRLSTGLRVNKAGDDPSGMGFINTLEARMRSRHAAVDNIQAALNKLNTAESGFQEVWDMVMRMRDLTVRAMNEAVHTDAELETIQHELDELALGITRLATINQFNGKTSLAMDGAAPTLDPPSEDNGRLTVSENTVLAGDPTYEALKQRMTHFMPGAVQMMFGMLGLSVKENLNVELHFEDLAFANPFESIAISFPAADTIRLEVNLAYFTPQLPFFTYPIFGNDPNSAITAETAFLYNLAQGVASWEGLNILDPNHKWGIFGYAIYMARAADRIIQWNPAAVQAAIAGSLTSNPSPAPINLLTKTGAEQYAETALAFQYIAETHGSNKIYDIIKNAGQGNTFQDAIVNELSVYADFAEFETAVDAWSLDYVANGPWNNITNGLGRTLTSPRDHSPQTLSHIQYGPDSGDTMDFTVPWIAGGSLDYLAMVDARDLESAGRSLATIDVAITQLAQAQADLGLLQNRFQQLVDEAEQENIQEAAVTSRIQDADMAQEVSEYVQNGLTVQAAADMLSQQHAQLGRVKQLLEQSDIV